MKKVLAAIAVGAASLMAFSACGSKMYLNKTYVFSGPERVVKLAIIPAGGEEGERFDTLFAQSFEDSTLDQTVVEPADIRKDLAADSTLLRILNKVVKKEYTAEQLKAGVSLRDDLTGDEYARLMSALDTPDIALIPVVLSMKSAVGMTFGNAWFRLYDMQSGSLIYEKKSDLNVNMGGEVGKAFLSLGQIGFAKDDYRTYFWNKHMGGNRP